MTSICNTAEGHYVILVFAKTQCDYGFFSDQGANYYYYTVIEKEQ